MLSGQQPLGVAGTLRLGRAPSCHDTTIMAHTSNGARRGDVSDPELDYLDAMGSPDGRETILLSILSSGDHALRAARGSWSSAVGRWGCRRA